jgi:hypothetical protein
VLNPVPLTVELAESVVNAPAPPLTTNDPALPVLTPNAVTTPVPVVIVAGAEPAPPPTTKAFAARAALDAHAVPLEKYGMPPDVPAIVNAGVVVGVPTDTMPPAQPTDVTVPEPPPPPAGVAQVPSPRQNVVADAPVPPLRLVTGKLPVTPVVSGRFVALVKTPLAGVPRAGVVSVGLVSVNPVIFDAVPPSDTAVDPIVTAELVSPALGIVVDAVTALAPLAYI